MQAIEMASAAKRASEQNTSPAVNMLPPFTVSFARDIWRLRSVAVGAQMMKYHGRAVGLTMETLSVPCLSLDSVLLIVCMLVDKNVVEPNFVRSLEPLVLGRAL